MTQDRENKPESGARRRHKRATASDVAEAAGVSRSAVSRAFTPGAYLDKSKRAVIMKTALQLGYRPNALAASLHGSSTNLVGVVAGDLDNPYDAEFVAQLISGLNQANKWPLMLGNLDTGSEDSILSMLNYPLDALIVRGGSIPTFLIDDCAKLGIPLIFSGLVLEAPHVDCVCCENAKGSAKAVDLLIASGRTSIGYLSGPISRSSANERLQGATAQLQHWDRSFVTTTHADFTFKGGREAAIRMFGDFDLDALICANDAMALGALSALRDVFHHAVPEDVAIIGFDDIAMASWPDFNLTTLRNPIHETVSEIVRLLDARLREPGKASEVSMIAPKLCERGTH